MTYHDMVKADILWPYCRVMGIASVDLLLMGKTQELDDIEVFCGAMSLRNEDQTSISRSPSPA